MRCPDDDSFASLFAGSLPATEREAIIDHASTCESCHAVLDCLAPTAASDQESDDDRSLLLRPGIKIGRFTIAERLGVGGMGIVHAAIDEELERRVALKLLRPGSGGKTARARLVREARTLARLSHPNIVAVFDVGEHLGNVYLVMELVEGGNILAWCRGRTSAEIVRAMIDAGRGLAAAHSAGFIHRDVKPDNILVGLDGRVRVTDFGLARIGESEMTSSAPVAGDNLTKTGTLLGTPAYMAPEATTGATSESADQWAFCASLYELLAGVRPFPVEPGERAAAIAAGRIATPPTGRVIPKPIMAILERGMRADPSARWPNMRVLVDALSAAQTTKQRRRRTIAFAVGIGATLAIAAGVAFAAWPTATTGVRPAPMTYTDQRPGCSCPYSACSNGCVSVCSAPAFRMGEKLPGISLSGRQEALVGASADGDTILYLAGVQCSRDRLYIARRRDDIYVSTDITNQVGRDLDLEEGCCTLTSDGQAIIFATKDSKRFVQMRLEGDRLLPATPLFSPELPLDTAVIRNPVLSADRMTLYFRIIHRDPGDRIGTRDGIYAAERSDADAMFGAHRVLEGTARRYDVVTGVSSDGLSLFLTLEFQTRVLIRKSKDDPFGDPGAWTSPATLHGWRAVPLADCRRVAVTHSPGGCEQEDIRFLEAEDQAPD